MGDGPSAPGYQRQFLLYVANFNSQYVTIYAMTRASVFRSPKALNPRR